MVKQEVNAEQTRCWLGEHTHSRALLQQAAGSEHAHPRLGRDVQGDTLIGRHKKNGAPPQRDIREGSGGGGRGVALDDQQDAAAVKWGDGVELHGGRDL